MGGGEASPFSPTLGAGWGADPATYVDIPSPYAGITLPYAGGPPPFEERATGCASEATSAEPKEELEVLTQEVQARAPSRQPYGHAPSHLSAGAHGPAAAPALGFDSQLAAARSRPGPYQSRNLGPW